MDRLRILNGQSKNDQLSVEQIHAIIDELLLIDSEQGQAINDVEECDPTHYMALYLNTIGAVLYARTNLIHKKRRESLLGPDGLLVRLGYKIDNDRTCSAWMKCIRNAFLNGGLSDCAELQLSCAELMVTKISMSTTTQLYSGHGRFIVCLYAVLRSLHILFESPNLIVSSDLADKLLVLLHMHLCVGLPGYQYHQSSSTTANHQSSTTTIANHSIHNDHNNHLSVSNQSINIPMKTPTKKSKHSRSKRLADKEKSKLTDESNNGIIEGTSSGTDTPSSSDIDADKSPIPKKGRVAHSSSLDSSDFGSFPSFSNLATECRSIVLGLLYKLVNSVPVSVLQAHWLRYMPDVQPSYFSSHSANGSSVGRLLLAERSDRLLGVLLSTCSLWMDKCHSYLATAEQQNLSKRQQSFTSLSLVVHGSLCEVHKHWLLALSAAKLNIIKVQIIKSLSVLAKVTPYMKCSDQLIPSLVQALTQQIHVKEANIRVAILNCLSALVANEHVALEQIDSNLLSASFSVWSLANQLAAVAEPLPVRLEALQAILALLNKVPKLATSEFTVTFDLLVFCDVDSSWDIRLYCLRLCNQLLTCWLLTNQIDDQCTNQHSALVLKLSQLSCWVTVMETAPSVQLWPYLVIELCAFVCAVPSHCVIPIAPVWYSSFPTWLPNAMRTCKLPKLQCAVWKTMSRLMITWPEQYCTLFTDLSVSIQPNNVAVHEARLMSMSTVLHKQAAVIDIDLSYSTACWHLSKELMQKQKSPRILLGALKLMQTVIVRRAGLPDNHVQLMVEWMSDVYEQLRCIALLFTELIAVNDKVMSQYLHVCTLAIRHTPPDYLSALPTLSDQIERLVYLLLTIAGGASSVRVKTAWLACLQETSGIATQLKPDLGAHVISAVFDLSCCLSTNQSDAQIEQVIQSWSTSNNC